MAKAVKEAISKSFLAGYKVIWYVGGNFTAIYDTQKHELQMK